MILSGKAASACVSRCAVQLHARARNSCLVQNEFKGDTASFEMQFEAIADKLLGNTADDAFDCSFQLCHHSFFAGRIVEQQHKHAEKKRELLASRSVKMPIVGAFPAGLGNPSHRAAPVEHARLIIQLCVPDARYIFLSV
jgi:hypothetical protein